MIKLIFVIITLVFNLPQDDDLVTKIYPIQDLEFVVANFDSAPRLDLQAALNKQDNIFNDVDAKDFSANKNYQAIIDIIQQNIEPDIWHDTASIKYWRGNLIIRAPQKIHDQLQ